MAIPEHLCEYTPGSSFNDDDPSTLYWIRENTVLYRHYPLRGVDIPTFRFYAGSFAKDKKSCYCVNSKLTGGNGATFRPLNFTYATDGQSVWTLGGKIKEADAESFVVCDDGVLRPHKSPLPYGFGKDKQRVFYFDFNGKANWVRKALTESFVSLNDGYYGMDEATVFCGAATIPKALVQHWRKLGGLYSTDDTRVFYFNRLIKEADPATFNVVPSDRIQLARDKYRAYWQDDFIEIAEFEKLVEEDLLDQVQATH